MLVHHDVLEAEAHALEIEELFQIALGVDGGHPALRVLVVHNAGLKAVGEEHHRAAALPLLDQVGVELGLLAALGHVHAGALGLDHSQHAPVVPQQHIVGKAHLGLVGHAGDLIFVQPVFALDPARVLQHGVDVELAGLVFGELQGLWHIALLLFLAPGGELRLERSILGHEGGQVDFNSLSRCGDSSLREGARGFASLFEGGGPRSGGGSQQLGIKGPLLVVVPIAVGDEVQEQIEVFQAQNRLLAADLLPGMGGGVADLADEVHPAQEVCVHHVPEFVRAHERDQLVVPGQLEIAVHGIHPLDGSLHRPAAVEHAGRGVDMQNLLRRDRHLREGGKLLLAEEYIKVGHGDVTSTLSLRLS